MRKYLVTFITTVAVLSLVFFTEKASQVEKKAQVLKVGFVYIGDTGTAFTNNFYRAQMELEKTYGDRVQTVAKYNIQENDCESAIQGLVDDKCNLIITASYGFGEATKRIAAAHPEVQFCHATGDSAKMDPVLPNFHNFMGAIYEGRYVSGVVAGMKLSELIKDGKLKRNAVKIGYVAAFPYPEVISGYTAFLLGVRSVVGEAEMIVRYTNTWSNHVIEKKCAEALIDEGCVLISQHSDTSGPAVACEEASIKKGKTVYHVGYNQSMTDVAPTTSLVSCRINWAPYIIQAAGAMLKGKRIESVVKTNISGNDSVAGFSKNWVEIIGLNRLIAAPGTQEEIERNIKLFKSGNFFVFKGDYVGVNPFDPNDIYDLRTPFRENENLSAPSFCYVLRDIITEE